MTRQMNDLDVLIVGAGPVGLCCSRLLSRLGVSNRVLDRAGQRVDPDLKNARVSGNQERDCRFPLGAAGRSATLAAIHQQQSSVAE